MKPQVIPLRRTYAAQQRLHRCHHFLTKEKSKSLKSKESISGISQILQLRESAFDYEKMDINSGIFSESLANFVLNSENLSKQEPSFAWSEMSEKPQIEETSGLFSESRVLNLGTLSKASSSHLSNEKDSSRLVSSRHPSLSTRATSNAYQSQATASKQESSFACPEQSDKLLRDNNSSTFSDTVTSDFPIVARGFSQKINFGEFSESVSSAFPTKSKTSSQQQSRIESSA